MKKLIRVLIALTLCFLLSASALAVENTYELSEIGVKVTIPADYHIVTRDTPETDPAFDLFVTRENWLQYAEENNVYLSALSHTSEIQISCTTPDETLSSQGDLRTMDAETLDALLPRLAFKYSALGATVEFSKIYWTAHAPFCRFRLGGTAPAIVYWTMIDGKGISLTFLPYTAAISYEDESTMEAIVNSMEFADASGMPAIGTKTTLPTLPSYPETRVTVTPDTKKSSGGVLVKIIAAGATSILLRLCFRRKHDHISADDNEQG